MGLFSSKKITYVSSSVWNMAGELQDRPSYLKSTVSRSALTSSKSFAEDIFKSQLEGPSMDQRQFFRWAKNNFSTGKLFSDISSKTVVDASNQATVTAAIPVPAGLVKKVQSAVIDSSDIQYWADQYMLDNHPDLISSAWEADYDHTTDEMVIQFADGSETRVTVPDYDDKADYLFVYYTLQEPDQYGPWVTGTVEEVPLDPSDASWALTSSTTDPDNPYSLETIQSTVTTITEVVEDGEDVQTTEEDLTYSYVTGVTNDVNTIYNRQVVIGNVDSGSGVIEEHQIMNLWFKRRIVTSTNHISNTVTVNGNITTEVDVSETVESIETYIEKRVDTQEVTRALETEMKVWIYKIGSGVTELDNLVSLSVQSTEFFPVIPLRHYNKTIDDAYFDNNEQTLAQEARKAFKNATGEAVDETLDSINDIDEIDDIDHAFMVFGVEANTEEQAGLRYIAEFLQMLIPYQNATGQDIQDWAINQNYAQYLLSLTAWQDAQSDLDSPLYGTPRPQHQNKNLPSYSEIRLKNDPAVTNVAYDVRIIWRAIEEELLSGSGKPDAKVGELWWEEASALNDVSGLGWFYDLLAGHNISQAKLYWQVSATSYRVFTVYGMQHVNNVYRGKTIVTDLASGGTGGEPPALTDPEPSGFVFPLHYPSLKNMPLTAANELAISNKILVFNSYKVVKKKWWQRGFFKFLFSIVIAVAAAFVFPGAAGLLGANVTVGTALGLTGTAAIVAGAVANAVAAVVLMTALEAGGSAIFGEEWGKLFAVVAMFFVGNAVNGFRTTGEFGLDWGELLKVDNLMQLTDAMFKGFTGAIGAKIEGLREGAEIAKKDFEAEQEVIENLWREFGYSEIFWNPLDLFTDLQDSSGGSDSTNSVYLESAESFLTRTLMCGDDICDMSTGAIDQFTTLSLMLPAPEI